MAFDSKRYAPLRYLGIQSALVASVFAVISFGSDPAFAQAGPLDLFKAIIDKLPTSTASPPAPTAPPPQAVVVAPSPPPPPPPPPMPPEQQAFANLPKEQMTQIQTILAQQNFLKGVVDGSYGGQTAAAIQAWQRANGFPPTGYMDGPQLGVLLKPTQTAATPPPGTLTTGGAAPAPAPAAETAAKIDEDTVIYEVGKDGKTGGPKDSIIWHGGGDGKFVKPTFESAITPQTMRVRASSAGAEVVWVYDEGDFALPFTSEKCGGATIDKICTVQTALHDFDGDGRPELVVTVGDGATSLKFWILQYFRPSASPENRAKKEYWSVLFEGDGQREIDLQGDRVIVPVGTKGDFDEFKLTGRKFMKKPK